MQPGFQTCLLPLESKLLPTSRPSMKLFSFQASEKRKQILARLFLDPLFSGDRDPFLFA